MKVRMVQPPTGYISLGGGPLQEWPKRGDVIDLPDVMAEGMVASGNAKRVTKDADDEKVETRPAPTASVETRPDAPVKRGPGRPRKNPEGKG